MSRNEFVGVIMVLPLSVISTPDSMSDISLTTREWKRMNRSFRTKQKARSFFFCGAEMTVCSVIYFPMQARKLVSC